MNVDINFIQNQYEGFFDKVIHRKDQVLKFKDFLEKETSWLTAPASTRYHLNCKKGLLIHSVGVTINALRVKDLMAPDISEESVVIVSLFHDLGKVGYAGKPYYLPNENKWEIEKRGITYKTNSEIVYMNLAVRSLYIIGQHILLSEEESQAIVAHDGTYPASGGPVNMEYLHRECRLQMILHFADKWTAAVNEDGRK